VFYGVFGFFVAAKIVTYFSSLSRVQGTKKGGIKTEIKLRRRMLRNHTLPAMRNDGKAHKRTTGITSGNITGFSLQPVAYERSREYLAHIAEIEIKRSLALAEAQRLSLR
jgi:hypothetical protein